LSRHDISVQDVFESAFLASSFAIENNIDGITWRTPADEYWDDLIEAGTIDVCWGGGSELFDWLITGNYLSPLTSPLMQEVESRVNDTIAGMPAKRNNTADQLVWIGSEISSFGFTVNHDFLESFSLPVPTAWANLSEPIYGSLLPTVPSIAMANAPDSASHKYIYDMIVQLMGWDDGWIHLSRMAGNAAIYGGSIEAQMAVENGERGIIPCIDYYGFRTQSNNPSCEYIVPCDGTVISPDPIAIANSTANKTMAEGFIDFVLSPYGQSLWFDEDIQRLPIMRDAFKVSGVTGVEDLYSIFNQTARSISFAINQTQSLLTSLPFARYYESVLTDSHVELVNCWQGIVEQYYLGTIIKSELDMYASQMGDPVSITDPKTSVLEKFTLDYALRINHDMTYDSAYSSTVQSRWTAAAKIQYLSVYASLPTSSLSPYVTSPSLLNTLQALLTLFIGSGGFAVIALGIQKYD